MHCLECGPVCVAKGIKTSEKISMRDFINRIGKPFTRWVKLDAGELLREGEDIAPDKVKTGNGSTFVITSLRVGVRRVLSALAEELDTI